MTTILSVNAQNTRSQVAHGQSDSLYFYYFKQKDILYSTFTECGKSLEALNNLINSNIIAVREGDVCFKMTAYIDASFPDINRAINDASVQAAAIKSYIVQRYQLKDDHFVFVARDKRAYKDCMGYTVVEMVPAKSVSKDLNKDFCYTLNQTRVSFKKAAARYNYDKFIMPSDTAAIPKESRKITRLDAGRLTDHYASVAEESRIMAEKEAVLSDSLMQKTIREFILMEYNVGLSGMEIFGDRRSFRNLNNETERIKSKLFTPMALKVNMLSLATGTLNLEANMQLSSHLTLHVPVSFNPWKYPIGDNKLYFKHLAVEPGCRYWFKSAYLGPFVGLYAIGITYNINMDGENSYETPLSHGQEYYNPKNYTYGWEDFNYGLGVSYGYAWLITPRFNIETEVGLGVGRMVYDRHYEGYVVETVNQWQIVPARLSVGFSFLF